MKDGYKYFPCENEYNTEEPIALGGEQESWSATKLSNSEFGHTRSQTRDLEAVESLQQMSADKQLENEQKKAAKVDAATSLFVLRDDEKEKGKALHFARSRSLDGQLRKCTSARSDPDAKAKSCAEEVHGSRNDAIVQLCRSRNQQTARGNKQVVRREEEEVAGERSRGCQEKNREGEREALFVGIFLEAFLSLWRRRRKYPC